MCRRESEALQGPIQAMTLATARHVAATDPLLLAMGCMLGLLWPKARRRTTSPNHCHTSGPVFVKFTIHYVSDMV